MFRNIFYITLVSLHYLQTRVHIVLFTRQACDQPAIKSDENLQGIERLY